MAVNRSAYRVALALSLPLCGCAASPPPKASSSQAAVQPASDEVVPGKVPPGDVAYVIDHGWHTDLALPADSLAGPLRQFRALYPGARTLIFGFGDRAFVMAHHRSLVTYAAALLPLPGAILVTAIGVTPDAAYGAAHVLRLTLPSGGDAALSDYIWRSLQKTRAGAPRALGPGPYPGSLFYGARATYALTYTCNSWTMDGLQRTGLPIGPGDALFSGQVVRRVRPFTGPAALVASGD